jgi:hypothetical protein
MGTLHTLSTPTTLDIPVDRVLEAAKAVCVRVLILGELEDGALYLAASFGDKREMLWWIEKCKQVLLADDNTC